MRRIAALATFATALALLGAAPPLSASGLEFNGAGQSRADQFRNQMRLLDGALATRFRAADEALPASVRGEVIPPYSGSYRGEYYQMARSAAQRHDVPEDLFLRLIQRESNWNPLAVSHKGAQGLAQLMPDTAALLRVDATDPAANLDGGARYLRMMFERFGSWRLALAAYNAGPEAVQRHGGVPPFAETTAYVRVILGG